MTTFSEPKLDVYVPKNIVPSDPHYVCAKCIEWSRKKYSGFVSDSGMYYKEGFAVTCPFIPKDEMYVPKDLQVVSSPEEISHYNALNTALLWGEKFLIEPDTGQPWRAWPYQRGPLLCNSPRKVYRFGRRTGKTTILAVEILWYLFTSCGGTLRDDYNHKVRRNLKVLLLAPQKTHIENIFDRIRAFMNLSPALKSCEDRNKRGSPQVISMYSSAGVGGGNMVSGYASGDSSGGNGLSARGQDADLVVIDEGAFIGEQTIEAVINPILYTRHTTRLIISSTPSGIPGDYFESICTKRPDFAEFYVPASERPDWAIVQEQVKKDFGSNREEWDKEVMALFSPAGIGVYREDLIANAQHNYEYGKIGRTEALIYTIGVDWNKEHGTEIIVLGTQKNSPHISFVVWAETINKKDFTAPRGIDKIVELNRRWSPAWIYVDAGGGDGGQMLRHYGRSRAGKHVQDGKLMNIVVDYSFGSKVEIREFDGTVKSFPAKPFMVENSVKKFELGEVKYPMSDLSLTKQLSNYIIARRQPNGTPVYGMNEPKWGDHRLDAMNLALIAIRIKFPSFSTDPISPLGVPIASVPGKRIEVSRPILPVSVSSRPSIGPSSRVPVFPKRTNVVTWGQDPPEDDRRSSIGIFGQPKRKINLGRRS